MDKEQIIGTCIVGAIIIGIVVLVIISMIKDKKKNKGGCTGNCGTCSGCK